MSNTNITTTTETTTVVVEENIVRIELNNIGVQGVPGANNDPVYVTVTNKTGALLTKGSIVYVSGGNGIHTQVTKALATSDATSARVLGWLAADIANNADGLCMVEGYLDGVNTQGVTEGAQLYLSGTTAGAYQVTKPVAPIHLVYVGVCVKASAGNGRVYVKVQNGYELNELHDVLIVSPQNNQVLAYDSATQLWKNAVNAPDGVTSITATAPLTGGTITSTGSIGLDQTALSITKSQVSDFTSGTVTSASTAQQAGTALFATNASTAVFATTSGTATFATNASTAVNLSGNITRSQVSDFTSGTVAQADNATTSGTAVFANTSGTATFATTSGTATYATNSGTAVFATNAGTAVGVSGSAITQSQVVNLVSDLAGKANLTGGNAFTGAQTVTAGAVGQVPLTLAGTSGQTADLFSVTGTVGTTSINSQGLLVNTGPVQTNGLRNPSVQTVLSLATAGINVLINNPTAGNIAQVVRGASGQTADVFLVQNSTPNSLFRVTTGQVQSFLDMTINGVTGVGTGAASGTGQLFVLSGLSTRVGAVIRGAASQSADLLQLQNSAGSNVLRVDFAGGLFGPSGAKFGVDTFSGVAFNGISNPAGAPTIPSLVVKANTSQTADLQQWHNSAGTVLAEITSTGMLEIRPSSGDIINFRNSGGTLTLWGGASSYFTTVPIYMTGGSWTGGRLSIDTVAAGNVGATIRGAASQTANLQEWQNSAGTIQASIDSSGMANLLRGNFRGAVYGTGIYYGAVNVLQESGGHGVVIQGRDSQTTDILRIRMGATPGAGNDALLVQNSGGTTLARILSDGGATFASGNVTITSTGSLFAAAFRTSNDWFQASQANSGGRITMTKQTAADSNPGANNARIYLRDGTTAGTLKLVVRAGAAGAETTILDNIPQ